MLFFINRFIIAPFYWILGTDEGAIHVYPHSRSRSFSIRFPTRFFKLLTIFFFIFLFIMTYLSLRNLVLGYTRYQIMVDNQSKKNKVIAYQNLIKNYLVLHGQKEKQIEGTIVTLFEPKAKIVVGGMGGSVNNFTSEDLHYEYNQYQSISEEDWDDFLSDLSNQNFINFVDKHLENLDSIYAIIDKFEIYLNQNKKLSQSIPSSWPLQILNQVHSKKKLSEESKKELQASFKKNSEGISVEEGTLAIDSILSLINDESSSSQLLAIDIYQPMAVVSTSRGIVERVEEKNGLWEVVIQHEYGFSTYYRGLDNVSVSPGELVNRSVMLGTIGNIHTSTPKEFLQLEYQIKIANKFTNPRDFLIFNY